VRVVGLHPDVLVCTSGYWQTTCTIVRGALGDGAGAEAFVIDSPVLPEELESLPALLDQVGWPCTGLLATHGDWDHLLARLAFPDAALGVAETTAARLTGEPGAAARELREFDDAHYIDRARPLRLGQVQALPVPGKLDVGDQELELHPTEGHVPDGMAIWVRWAKVLVCGDFLSPVEIPMLSDGGSRSAYRATLARLAPLVEQADHVVPGHGVVLDSVRAAAILREDLAYLDTLELPLARRSAEQRRIHAENLERIAATEGAAAAGGGAAS
jgi:glyoxylase-like metal-dependent hydrolase (beta-lactamase superfamily II)